jgi:hypothetical protein
LVGGNCFKVVTNLENKRDKDIPEGWYEDTDYVRYTAHFIREDVNYGTSSLNILWYEVGCIPSFCTLSSTDCKGGPLQYDCNDKNYDGCGGSDFCYIGSCIDACEVSSCGGGN